MVAAKAADVLIHDFFAASCLQGARQECSAVVILVVDASDCAFQEQSRQKEARTAAVSAQSGAKTAESH